MHFFDTYFLMNFILAMTMQWFLTLWIGVIRPQNWKLPLKWMGWALIPGVIGKSWALLLPPLSALFYLIHHRSRMTIVFVNATIIIYLIVILINDVCHAVSIELFGYTISDMPWFIVGRLVFQIVIYMLFLNAVTGMRVRPENLAKLVFSRKEQMTVMALLVSLGVLTQLALTIIHQLGFSHAMMTFALSMELVIVLIISASLYIFLRSFYHRQRVRALYQETLLRTRYDRRISNQVQAIREFKQTYQKQMLRLGDYLDAEDYAGLTAYYQALTSRWRATRHLAGVEEVRLQQLSDPALKSLLFQKILAAQNAGLSLRLEVPTPVRTLPMDSVYLLRVVGILLDNAIEAGAVDRRTDIYCAILNYPDSMEFAVANPVSRTKPPKINEFMGAGYTTKGQGHGQGLSTVREIVDQTPNAALQVELKRGMLFFTLILTKSGR